MASKTTPDNSFGQLLICLRMSKLNFVVKETPFSAYLTIRKKFVKSSNEDVFENANVIKGSINDESKQIERENFHLKQKVKEIETECAILHFEKEEFEMKIDAVEKKNAALEDQIEVEMARNRELVNSNGKLCNGNNIISEENVNLKKERKEERNTKTLNNKKEIEEKFKLSIKDLEENVYLLENIVENRDLEIYKLKEELETFEATTTLNNPSNCRNCENETDRMDGLKEHTENVHAPDIASTSTQICFKCDQCDEVLKNREKLKAHTKTHHQSECSVCDVDFITEKDLQRHIGEEHGYKCDICDYTCKNEEKLKKHMCRVTIKNPTFKHLYIKNWIIPGKCVSIFSNRSERETAILHSQDCVKKKNKCLELPDWYPQEDANYDGELWHLECENFEVNGNINWELLDLI